ncbi:transglycosylase domain-containing protein, partial [Marinomonas profundimaris]
MAKRKFDIFSRAWTIIWRALLLLVVVLLLLRFVPPPTTAFMLQSPYPVTQDWISIDELPSHVPLAFVSSEDQRFPNHYGVDFA